MDRFYKFVSVSYLAKYISICFSGNILVHASLLKENYAASF